LYKSFPPQVAGRQEFVTGNATNLPFRAEAFDLVLSIDVYEHIPAPERSVYLHELLRCARRMVILAAPFADGW
jgi:Methyltransferase domain.